MALIEGDLQETKYCVGAGPELGGSHSRSALVSE
jgi:hypothetical protein